MKQLCFMGFSTTSSEKNYSACGFLCWQVSNACRGVERLGYCPRFITFDIIALYVKMEFAHSVTFGGASIPAMTCKVSYNHILWDSCSNYYLKHWEHRKIVYCAHPKSDTSGSLCFVGSCRRMRGRPSTRAWISIAAAFINLNVGPKQLK